jgi:hypothetical protein
MASSQPARPVPLDHAVVLAAVKDKPSVAAEEAAILDRRSTRRPLSSVAGTKEGLRWGPNQRR